MWEVSALGGYHYRIVNHSLPIVSCVATKWISISKESNVSPFCNSSSDIHGTKRGACARASCPSCMITLRNAVDDLSGAVDVSSMPGMVAGSKFHGFQRIATPRNVKNVTTMAIGCPSLGDCEEATHVVAALFRPGEQYFQAGLYRLLNLLQFP
jgi:hypothetical protein